MPLLLDLVVVYLTTTIVSTPNGQFFDCAIIVFSEQYVEDVHL